MDRDSHIARRLDRASEVVVIAVVVLAPGLSARSRPGPGRPSPRRSSPWPCWASSPGGRPGDSRRRGGARGVGLAGLAQSVTLPDGWTAPIRFVQVAGDPGRPWPPRTATIAQDRQAAIGVACCAGRCAGFLPGGPSPGLPAVGVAAAIAINAAVPRAVRHDPGAELGRPDSLGCAKVPRTTPWFAGGPSSVTTTWPRTSTWAWGSRSAS